MSRWLPRALLLALAASTLAGCGLLFRAPELTLEKLQMSGLGLSGATLTAQLNVGNPNFFDVTTERITYELAVEGKPAGKGVYEKPFTVPGRSTLRLDFPVNVSWSAAMGGLRGALDSGLVNSTTVGVITVRSFLGPLEVPYRIDSRLGDNPDGGAR